MFEILIHLATVVDLERIDPYGLPVITQLDWVRGVADMAEAHFRPEEVAPPPPPPRPARNSCRAEFWQGQRDHLQVDEDDDEGRRDQTQMPPRRTLLQRLRWPGERGRSRDRSPRRHGEESSRQGRRQRQQDRSLSPATRRSRERSLERMMHRLNKTQEPEASKNNSAAGNCSTTKFTKDNRPDETPPRTRTEQEGQDTESKITVMLLKGPQVIAIQANMLPDPMVEESTGTGAQHIQHKSPKIDHQVGKEQDMSFSHDESPTEPPWVADPMLEEADIASALAQSSTTLNTDGQCMGGQYTDEVGDHTTDPNTMIVISNQEWNEAESNHQNDDVEASQYKDAVPFVELMVASVPPPILQTPRRAAR